MQPLYFLPNVQRDALVGPDGRLVRQVLADWGLAEVWRDVIAQDDITSAEVKGQGPGGKSGLIVAALAGGDRRPPLPMGFYPAVQDWQPVGDDAGLWIGLSTTAPVRPDDLARRRQSGGYAIAMANDAGTYCVPVIRRPDETSELPADIYWDRAGRFVEAVQEEYRALWEITAEILVWFTEPDGFNTVRFSKARALELAIAGLGANYRYDRALHYRLRLVDRDNWAAVTGAMIDLPKLAIAATPDEATSEAELAEQKKSA